MPDVPDVPDDDLTGAEPGEGAIGFGIDIGGSGIKGAPVSLTDGRLLDDRLRIPTPRPATPKAVAPVVAELVERFGWQGPLGVTFPAVVRHGVAQSAANVDESWIGTDIQQLLGQATGLEVKAVNDADAAGLAEARFGSARGVAGVVLVFTLGTGIGSALLVDGLLVPNTELGHLEVECEDAEVRASADARERERLSWTEWARRLQVYLRTVERLFSPDLIVVGGGVSRKSDKFLPLLELAAPIVPATLRNQAGIVGAAMLGAGAPA